MERLLAEKLLEKKSLVDKVMRERLSVGIFFGKTLLSEKLL